MHGRPGIGLMCPKIGSGTFNDLSSMHSFSPRLGTSAGELLSGKPPLTIARHVVLKDVKVELRLETCLSVQVYALIAIACMKLGEAIQLHSSRSEVRVLHSLRRICCIDVQMSGVGTQCILHLHNAHDMA